MRLPAGGGCDLGDGGTLGAAQHLDQQRLLAALTRTLPGLTRLARPARLAWLPLAFGALDGGAQHAQDLVGPGFARTAGFGLQPMLGGPAGGEQLLLHTDMRLALARFGVVRLRRRHRRVFS